MTEITNYRSLTSDEISRLEGRGCTSTDWSRVEGPEGDFDCSRLTNVEFSGDVRLGRLEGTFHRPGGLDRRSSLTNVTLHNVTVGNGVFIRHVANYIANYDIADGVYIDNIDSLVCSLDTTFGIGTEVSVLNETGGREVPIYERMSAQTAYLIAMYRHNRELVEKLVTMVKVHADSLFGLRGNVGKNAEITNCGTITNVRIGAYARVKGATRLKDGTITGSKAAPVTVGRDVIAEGFVFASGSRVDDGAVVHHCFVGQASALSHLYSAHDSLFFANCACENGEAAAIFGGPYTVSMHKSSLLIAGMFSFLNAGSGSNQSNHMYKLGPIHQGVVERGSKTTSDSYILWPARIGAFSLVMGRHVNHPDTSRLPFSYLIESRNESFLVPGVNLRSVGTIRDAQKWPRRDKRTDPDKLDAINFNLLSPYTVGKMMGAISLLNDLERTAGATAERFAFQAMTIEARALRRGREYYGMAIDKFMGNSVINRLGKEPLDSREALANRLAPTRLRRRQVGGHLRTLRSQERGRQHSLRDSHRRHRHPRIARSTLEAAPRRLLRHGVDLGMRAHERLVRQGSQRTRRRRHPRHRQPLAQERDRPRPHAPRRRAQGVQPQVAHRLRHRQPRRRSRQRLHQRPRTVRR